MVVIDLVVFDLESLWGIAGCPSNSDGCLPAAPWDSHGALVPTPTVRAVRHVVELLASSGVRFGVLLQASSAAEAADKRRLAAQLELPGDPLVILYRPESPLLALHNAAASAGAASPGGVLLFTAPSSPAANPSGGFLWAAVVPQGDPTFEGAGVLPDGAVGMLRAWWELPGLLARCMQEAAGGASPLLVVGVHMKESRLAALVRRGVLSLRPGRGGAVFMPLLAGAPLEVQGRVDALLHKATDLMAGPSAAVSPQPGLGGFLGVASDLLEYLSAHPEVCPVDPIGHVALVADRRELGRVLGGLEAGAAAELAGGAGGGRGQDRGRGGGRGEGEGAPPRVRTPRWCLLSEGGEEVCTAALAAAGVPMPCIVKPVVACGHEDSHHMAIVLRPTGFAGLRVPLPAVAQEYVNHGGRLHKVYVLGDAVRTEERASTPDTPPAGGAEEEGGAGAVEFDSLKALPSTLGAPQGGGREAGLHSGAVAAAVRCLRAMLGLSLFGFDIVVDSVSGDHVVVDVNYFPSFGGVEGAGDLLQAAVRAAHARWREGAAHGG